jgi:hypothetical protein
LARLQQLLDFGLQFRLLLVHPPIAHRFVLAGIALDLAPIDGHVPQPRAAVELALHE